MSARNGTGKLIPFVPDPDPLPVQALPPACAAYAASVADNLQIPSDLSVSLVLASLSAALVGRVEVEARAGWREPVGLYVAPILPPASRKSPAVREITGPIRELEADAVRAAGPKVAAAMDILEVAGKALERTKADAARGKATPEEVEAARFAYEAAKAKIPPDGRLFAGDITPEEMVRRMAAQGGRLAIIEPEPGPLQLVAGRYSDSARLDEIKKAWSAEPIVVDRVGREGTRVDRPALTLLLCLQPGVLEALQNSDAFRHEGVLGRFLWLQPPHGLGKRLTGADVPPLDVGARDEFIRISRTLFRVEPRRTEGGEPTPHILRLHPAALPVLHEFEAQVEEELADAGRFATIRDWAGKMVGQSLRVAGLLELAGRAEEGVELFRAPIGVTAMDCATRILWALASHARTVLGPRASGRIELLQYVLDWIVELPLDSTVGDLYQHTKGKAAIGGSEDLRNLLDELEARGYIHVLKEGEGRGRKRERIELSNAFLEENPKILEMRGRDR